MLKALAPSRQLATKRIKTHWMVLGPIKGLVGKERGYSFPKLKTGEMRLVCSLWWRCRVAGVWLVTYALVSGHVVRSIGAPPVYVDGCNAVFRTLHFKTHTGNIVDNKL